MPTDQREVLREYVERKHGYIDLNTFNAIFEGAQLLCRKTGVDNDTLRQTVNRNSKVIRRNSSFWDRDGG